MSFPSPFHLTSPFSGISNHPFSAHQNGAETLNKYCHEVTCLLAFLLRNRGIYPLPLSPALTKAIDRLKSLRFKSDPDVYANAVQATLFLLWGTPWTPSDDNSLGDPTHCYIALSSIKSDFRWAHPKEITQPLAKLTYCLRLVVLRHAHSTDNVEGTLQKLSPMYHEKVESPFNTIRSLQHLASSIAQSSVSLPAAVWTDDTYSALIFHGSRISMLHMRNMGRELLIATAHFMVENVFCGKPFRLAYDHIADDLTDISPGYSYLDDPRNSFIKKHERALLQAIIDDPTLCARFIKGFHSDTGTPYWNVPQLRLWYRHYCDLQLRFAVLIQLLGGAPARGTELTCIQLRNSPSQVRGFYKMHNRWVILCQYSKTSATTGHDKFLPHGVDALSGDMIFQSHVFALPLAKVFASIIFSNDIDVQKLLHTYLFPNIQKVYDTERLSEQLKVVSTSLLGVSLTTSLWRQLFVAVRRKHCPDLDLTEDLEGVDTVGALQAGHTSRTEGRAYGLTPDSFSEHSEEIVQAFLGFTDKWDDFMNVPRGSTVLPFTILLSPSTYLSHLPKLSEDPHQPFGSRSASIVTRLEDIIDRMEKVTPILCRFRPITDLFISDSINLSS